MNLSELILLHIQVYQNMPSDESDFILHWGLDNIVQHGPTLHVTASCATSGRTVRGNRNNTIIIDNIYDLLDPIDNITCLFVRYPVLC